MAQKTRANLTTQANIIKNETAPAANTATRVGTMHVDSIDSDVNWLSDVVTDLTSNSDLKVPTVKAVVDGLDDKLTPNAPITGATKTKITYDANGLVTSGADATTADIADSVDKRYQTDNQQTFNDATSSIQTQIDGKQADLGFTPENVANKATDFSTIDNTLYPTTQAVSDLFATTPSYNLFIGVNTNTPTGILADKAAFEVWFAPINPNLNIVHFDLSFDVIRIEAYGIDDFGDLFLTGNTEVTSFQCDFDVNAQTRFLAACTALTSINFIGNVTTGLRLLNGCTALESITFLGNIDAGDDFLSNCTALASATFLGTLSTGNSFLVGCTSLTKLAAIERNASILQAETTLGITAFTMVQLTKFLTQTGTVTATATSGINAYFFTGAGSLVLPTAVGNTAIFKVKNSHSANITVTFTGGQNADGSTSITLIPNQALEFISNNANYNIF
jgi:hypothetical protein